MDIAKRQESESVRIWLNHAESNNCSELPLLQGPLPGSCPGAT